MILLWVVSMLPHVFGNVRARSRNHDIQLLSEWLRGEFGSLDPDSSLDDALEAAAALHPRDRDAFLETLLGDMGAVAVLSQYTIEQLLTRFEARREAACSLPVSTLPTVAQAESPLGTSQTRTQLAGSAVTGSATGIDIADVAGLIASEPIAQQRAAIDLSTGGPRGP